MSFARELDFLTDIFRKYGIQINTAALDHPPPPVSDLARLLPSGNSPIHTLREHLPPVRPNTVYIASYRYCCFTYILLPDMHPDTLLIIGPYLKDYLSADNLWSLPEFKDIPFSKKIEKYYSSLPILLNSSHLHLVMDAFFDRLWSADGYTVETLNEHPFSFMSHLSFNDAQLALVNAAVMEERYAQENDLIDAIRNGQLLRVESFLSRITPSVFEKRTSDPVRNLKNYCIITNTLLRKAAEQGGVHPIYIDELSSSFAMKIEQLTSAVSGPALISEMAQSYCRLVRTYATKSYSPPVQKAIMLISADLTADLSLSNLAKQINVSGSYLSALFRKETGSTVTDYVVGRRVRHACYLLETTRMQIQNIAQLCGLDDVHYFSRIFKKLTGLTPRQYRQAHNG